MNRAIPLLLALVAAATLSLAFAGTQIVDKEPAVGIERLAELVCELTKGSGRQIGRAATVARLVGFFKSLPGDHKLARCRDRYGESVERLQQVLETGNDNVCGHDKVTAMEQFHRRYISEVDKFKRERKAAGWRAPHLIRLVFMQYAHLVSSVCEKSAAIELAQVADKMVADGDEALLSDSNQFVGQVSEVAGVSDLSKGYQSVFNLWSLLDKLPVDKSEKFAPYLGGSPQRRLTIAVQQGAKLREVQGQCVSVMRPIYARSLLGVLRLLDLGYYPRDEFLAKEVREMPVSRQLLVLTQVCEILLPIAVVEDSSLSPEQILLLPKDQPVEEANLRLSPEQGPEYIQFPANSLPSLDTLEVVAEEEAKSLADELERAVRRRDDAGKLIFKVIINCFRYKIKSKIGSMLMAAGGLRKRALEEELASEVDPNELASLIDGRPEREVRRKRGIGKVLGRVGDAFLYLIKAALVLVLGLIYFGLYMTLVYGLSAFAKFFLKLTGIRILWIRDFQRVYHVPLIRGMDKYKELIANDED